MPYFQDFLQELLEKDAKVESLVKMGFLEDEANMDISSCGMLYTELVACYFILWSCLIYSFILETCNLVEYMVS